MFNLDEVDSSDLQDCQAREVAIPFAISTGEVFHAVSRRYRHVTLLACVSAVGDSLIPIIISQASVGDCFMEPGCRAG
jgi:hypothetical protein